jgi:hypothetical protein
MVEIVPIRTLAGPGPIQPAGHHLLEVIHKVAIAVTAHLVIVVLLAGSPGNGLDLFREARLRPGILVPALSCEITLPWATRGPLASHDPLRRRQHRAI